ncbi:fimbrial protein [Lelliottia amnigena]|jgi:major type 1 subunit fimbrin (pilin)
MKISFFSFTLSSLFLAAVVQAEDHSATIDIHGSVIGTNNECFVTFADYNNNSNSAMATLTSKINELPVQGQNATDPNWINYQVNGCDIPVSIVLHGIPDDADGTTLANSDNSAASAKGVGIGLFDEKLAPLNINNQIIVNRTNGKAKGQFNIQLVKLNGETPVEGLVHGSLTIDVVRL